MDRVSQKQTRDGPPLAAKVGPGSTFGTQNWTRIHLWQPKLDLVQFCHLVIMLGGQKLDHPVHLMHYKSVEWCQTVSRAFTRDCAKSNTCRFTLASVSGLLISPSTFLLLWKKNAVSDYKLPCFLSNCPFVGSSVTFRVPGVTI